MTEREYGSKIVAFCKGKNGNIKRMELHCDVLQGKCLDRDIWGGEGLYFTTRRYLEGELNIDLKEFTKIDSYFDSNCSKCPLKKTSEG